MNLKKDIPESAVIAEVKAIIKATGIKLQRINTGCFAIGTGRNRINGTGCIAAGNVQKKPSV